MISVYLETGLSKDEIIDKLVEKLEITPEQAKIYYDKYEMNN